MGEDEEKKVSIIIPLSKFEIIDGYAKQRGPKYPYSHIILEAIDQYIEQRQNPKLQIQKITDAMQSHPEMFAPLLAPLIKDEVRAELRKILGDKYRP